MSLLLEWNAASEEIRETYVLFLSFLGQFYYGGLLLSDKVINWSLGHLFFPNM